MENEEIKKQEEKKDYPSSFIGSAHEAAERLKAENERMEQNIKKLEEIKAFEILGGKSEGAAQQEVQDNGLKEFWKGTEIGKAIEKHG